MFGPMSSGQKYAMLSYFWREDSGDIGPRFKFVMGVNINLYVRFDPLTVVLMVL